jgi:uncharacterized SAM-binding protein YcdF (DUF218 family)
MTEKRKRSIPRIIKAFILLAAAAVLAYVGIFAYVCIRERSVPTDVPDADKYDAIIVLGAQVKRDGTPNVQLALRLDTAYDAYAQKNVPVVVCGAQGKDEPVPEAEAMKTYLMEKGIPEQDILTDPDSFNTSQNLKNAAALLKERQEIQKVLIVTSDYHIPRAMALAQDLGFEACGMGSPCKPEYWLKNHAREVLSWCKYWGVKYLHLPLE